MLTLGIDSAGLEMGVALARNGRVMATRKTSERRGQGEILPVFLDEMLAEAGATYADITDIAIVTGPGSFTGLRMGIAAAQGLSRATGCRLIGLDRFTLVAKGCGQAPRLAIVLDSLRDELYVRFGNEEPVMLIAEQILSRVLAEGWSVAGDGVAALGTLPPSLSVLDGKFTAATLAEWTTSALSSPEAESSRSVLPYYLRPPDISLPRS